MGGIFDEVAENSLVVVSNHADFLNVRHFRNGGQAVPDDGVASNVKQRLLRSYQNVAL